LEKSSFFNSVDGDRKYQASDFASYFNSFITNGVFPNPSTNLQVIANNNMTVTIKAGKAWINGYIYINDNDLILPVDVADGLLNRIDRVVVKYNTVGRNITASIKKGDFATTPVAKTLQRDADAYELGIADVYVGQGVISIIQANITDTRMNTSLCGWVNSLIQADTTAIFNQYQSWFTTQSGAYNTSMTASETQFESDFITWFNTIKDTLGTDLAGNLQLQIGILTNLTTTEKTNLVGAISEVKNQVNIHETDKIKHIPYAVTTNTGNNYSTTLGITALVDGITIRVKCNANSTGAVTINPDTLGAKAVVKANGTAVTNWKNGGIYTLAYNITSGNFILQGEGGSGNATASDLLSGKTASTDAGDITGTMTNKVGSATVITPSTADQAIPQGYYGGVVGDGKVAGDVDLIASNIKEGKSIFGVTGVKNLSPVTEYTGWTDICRSGVWNGNYIACAVGVNVVILKLNNDNTLSLVTTYVLPSMAVALAWYGDYLACAHISAPRLTLLKLNNDNTLSLVTTYTLAGTPSQSIAWHGNYLACPHGTTPYLTLLKFDGVSTLSLVTTYILAGTGQAVAWYGNYLAVGHSTSPYLTLLKLNNDNTLSLVTTYTLQGSIKMLAWNGNYLACAHMNSPYFTLLKFDRVNTLSLVTTYTLAGIGQVVSWYRNYLAVGHSTSPYFTLLKFDGVDALSLVTTYDMGSSNVVYVTSWYGNYLAVGHFATLKLLKFE
jgi:hypothetical protein